MPKRDMDRRWTSLGKVPVDVNNGCIVSLNDREFIMAPSTSTPKENKNKDNKSESRGIHKYDVHKQAY